LAAATLLVACGSNPLDKNDPAKYSNEKLYEEAKDEMASSGWANAIKLLERLESRDPFSVWAQQAKLEIAYCQWKDGEPALALATLDRFIKQHPNHQVLDYVYYLRGLINFNENQSFFAKIGGQDLTERDPKAARDAFDAFKEMVTRFPDSKYAKDATDRMSYLINALASHEVHVARYYLRRGAPLAALNRAQYALRFYQSAPATEEALAIMVVAYEELNRPDLQKDAERVLMKNFPNTTLLATVKSYESGAWWKLW
jgi:outer membrane protein assembly factor BamD